MFTKPLPSNDGVGDTYIEQGDFISLLLFFQNSDFRLKMFGLPYTYTVISVPLPSSGSNVFTTVA
jgi:hypothetical protein